MHTFIDLVEGEEPEIEPGMYPTGHGDVYCLRVGGSEPGTIRFGDLNWIKKFHEATGKLLDMAADNERKLQEKLKKYREGKK